MFVWLIGFIRKDFKLFLVDRQAVVMAFVVPVLIASILGWLDSAASNPDPNRKVTVMLVDQDQTSLSKGLVEGLTKSGTLTVVPSTEAAATAAVKAGTVPAFVTIPVGFARTVQTPQSGALTISLLTDPANPSDGQLVKGIVTAVASRVAGGPNQASIEVVDKLAVVAGSSWAKAAHDYSGFGLQGLLFFAVEMAVGMARERRQGIWRRLRASPVPAWVILGARGTSSAIIALGIIFLMFGFGAVLFGIRILGSPVGFVAIAVAAALMASTFGLFVSTLGRTESHARGLSILLILVMLATGGAWFPMDQMPNWVQKAANFLPVRHAVEGFDSVTWRGDSLGIALHAAAILLAFAVAFAGLAALRFRFGRDPSLG